jgi:hypothetical protein
MRIGFALLLALTAVVCTALVGCGGGGGGSLPDPIIRFINSSPDANPLDFHIDENTEATALTYLSDSGDITVDNGDSDISIWDNVSGDEIDAIAFNLAQDKKYLAVALGLETFGSELDKRLRVIAFTYDKNPPNGSKARLLIMHAYSRDAGFSTPDIDFQGGQVGSYDPNNPQYKQTGIAFGASTPSTLEVDANVALIFQARRAETENVIASEPTFTFDEGGIYLALVTGVESGVGAQAPQIKYIKLN